MSTVKMTSWPQKFQLTFLNHILHIKQFVKNIIRMLIENLNESLVPAPGLKNQPNHFFV